MKPLSALLGAALLLGCGHVIRHAPNYGDRPFDFKRPPSCSYSLEPVGPMGKTVEIRYLGAGGLAIGWQGETVLMAPFFSNYGLLRVPFGKLSPSESAIGRGMAEVPRSTAAILAGHSHYDHLGDLPVVATEFAPRARVYVNDSGVTLLKPFLADRVESLQPSVGREVQLQDAAGRALPFRVHPLLSEHAPHIDHYLWGKGEVPGPPRPPWTAVPIRALKAGTPLAFVIDLLGPRGEVRYRIYYQDAASGAGKGEPPETLLKDGHAFDLAVLCMASYNRVDRAPQSLLAKIRPRHVLAIHYENFFSRNEYRRFAPLLTDRLANAYLKKVEDTLQGQDLRGPVGRVCGPSAKAWTMPLPGEVLHFQVGAP